VITLHHIKLFKLRPRHINMVTVMSQKEKEPKEVKREIKMESATWEEFEKFEIPSKKVKKSWIKEAIERATKEPVKLEGLSKGQILAMILQVRRYNLQSKLTNKPLLQIKYDFKKGIVMIAPETKPETQ
jgi:small-conductance mechanosensitive channel